MQLSPEEESSQPTPRHIQRRWGSSGWLPEENRRLGIISDSHPTIRQLLKKYYFQEQNRQKNSKERGKTSLSMDWEGVF